MADIFIIFIGTKILKFKEKMIFNCQIFFYFESMNLSTIPPTPLCFSCGNKLPEGDFDSYHLITQEMISKGVPIDAAQKITLDSHLSKSYPRRCCRAMFLGDPIEYRKKMALYDLNNLNHGVVL